MAKEIQDKIIFFNTLQDKWGTRQKYLHLHTHNITAAQKSWRLLLKLTLILTLLLINNWLNLLIHIYYIHVRSMQIHVEVTKLNLLIPDI